MDPNDFHLEPMNLNESMFDYTFLLNHLFVQTLENCDREPYEDPIKLINLPLTAGYHNRYNDASPACINCQV